MIHNISTLISIVLANRGKTLNKIVTGDTSLRDDLGFDSLDLAELTARIEAAFDVDIFESGLVYTVGDIVQKIMNKNGNIS